MYIQEVRIRSGGAGLVIKEYVIAAKTTPVSIVFQENWLEAEPGVFLCNGTH